MKKRIEELNGYIANNPFIKREPFKHFFMRNSFILYKKLRIKVSKWYPLADWQNMMWLRDRGFHWIKTNAAVNSKKTDDRKAGQPYLNIEFISILDLIPKEQINDVLIGIEKFRKKHGGNSFFDRYINDAGYFDNFYDGEAYSSLGDLSIKDRSKLKKYTDRISFHTVNISDSFCCLNIIVDLNKDLNKDLSTFLISNVPDQNRVVGYERKRWYQIRNLGNGIFPGNTHKFKIFEDVITDIKWNVMKELSKSIKSMIFQRQSVNTKHVISISTNIDGNRNEDFWRSLDVDTRYCDFTNNFTACIAWRNHENAPFFIYNKESNNEDDTSNNGILAYHIGDELSAYLIADRVNKSIRTKLKNIALKYPN